MTRGFGASSGLGLPWKASPPCTLIGSTETVLLGRWLQMGGGVVEGKAHTTLQIRHSRDQDFKGNLLFLKGLRGLYKSLKPVTTKGDK